MVLTRQENLTDSYRDLSPEERDRLAYAREHIFDTSTADSTAELAKANLQYGLAKIHWLQEQLGLTDRAAFLAAPDFTVTRNTTRWLSGFAYGGSLQWGSGDTDLVILDLKPNACGMIVGGLDELPSVDQLLPRLDSLRRNPVEIDGIEIEWDFGKGNHFIDLLQVEAVKGANLHPYAFVMHFAGGELRRETDQGMGLYWNKSPALQASMTVYGTPFGELRTLEGRQAEEYYCFYQKVDAFVRKRRLHAAQALFGDFELISNSAHQGLAHKNEILLGCYRFSGPDQIYPIGLRANLPAYLVRGLPNLSTDIMEWLGFLDRADRLDQREWITNANLLPHGGGYSYPQLSRLVGVHHFNGSRYFEVDLSASSARKILTEVRNLPFEYRGEEVVQRTLQLGMAEIVARLDPVTVLKV